METNHNKHAILAISVSHFLPTKWAVYMAKIGIKLRFTKPELNTAIKTSIPTIKEDSTTKIPPHESTPTNTQNIAESEARNIPNSPFLPDSPLKSQAEYLIEATTLPPTHPPMPTPTTIAPPPENTLPTPPQPIIPPPPKATPPETPTPIKNTPYKAQLKNQYLQNSEQIIPPIKTIINPQQQQNQLTTAIASFNPSPFANTELMTTPTDSQTPTITLTEGF